jgi:hypothetical protein
MQATREIHALGVKGVGHNNGARPRGCLDAAEETNICVNVGSRMLAVVPHIRQPCRHAEPTLCRLKRMKHGLYIHAAAHRNRLIFK